MYSEVVVFSRRNGDVHELIDVYRLYLYCKSVAQWELRQRWVVVDWCFGGANLSISSDWRGGRRIAIVYVKSL